MSDQELADHIAAAGGRVAIGFNERGARRGVDSRGQILVSRSSVEAGKEYLRSLGVTIEREGAYTPFVMAVIDPALLSKLRDHPLIAYVEPEITGTFFRTRSLPEDRTPDPSGSIVPSESAYERSQQMGVTRWDAPWWKMNDDELADSVAAVDGRVAIGFKEPGSRGGVDERGRILVSPATVRAGKEHLRSLGVAIEREAKFIPMVIAVIDPAIVPALRRHPLIDYVEPEVKGTFFGAGYYMECKGRTCASGMANKHRIGG